MKIAVTTENGQVFQHFGVCKVFTVFEVEDESIMKQSELDTSESGHEALVDILKENHVDVLICGGIGSGAKNALREARIEIVPGVSGSIKEVIKKYLSGEKLGIMDYECNHHQDVYKRQRLW